MKWKIGMYVAAVVLFLTACEDILEEVDLSDRQVAIFAPLDSTVVNSNTVNFNWDRVEDATAYRFQLAAPSFVDTQQLVLDSIFEVDTLGRVSTQIQQELVNGNYEWRIRAQNSGFETPYTSSTFTVNGDENVDLDPPNTPQLIAPLNGASQDEATVNFSWTREDVPGTAERDSIYFFSDAGLQNLVGKDIGANKAYAANFASGTFYWFVKAFDAAGNESDDSSTFSFTVN
ncbi:hypothetical protein [Flagellimonas allohymeniacidonis]|uniref:Fibronectin type-III domain-containing protein n=1 Tax=Flagellimonas allohymeniacidonis TaxID=2517819 RepID=A0A4Q8QGX6_9FLAO|nr:hypothetical protein [Allomuricauda hymeniacidonis]TAI48498.1 hypothetical protein EW142_01450 [Allomuricauda hymeniacidonis]